MALLNPLAPGPASDTVIERFQDDGAVVVRNLLDAAWMVRLRTAFDDLLALSFDPSAFDADKPGAAPAMGDAPSSLMYDDGWLANATMRDFVLGAPMAELAARAMNSHEVRVYEDLLLYRAAGPSAPTDWHQDAPLWPLTGTQMCSIWLSLEPVTPETGALRFVAGSHRGPAFVPYVPSSMHAQREQDMVHFTGGAFPDIEGAHDSYRFLTFSTEPGDVILFHPNAIHGAFGSRADRPRRTFSVRYLGDDIRWQSRATLFHDWLYKVGLADGDRITGERFPMAWPRR